MIHEDIDSAATEAAAVPAPTTTAEADESNVPPSAIDEENGSDNEENGSDDDDGGSDDGAADYDDLADLQEYTPENARRIVAEYAEQAAAAEAAAEAEEARAAAAAAAAAAAEAAAAAAQAEMDARDPRTVRLAASDGELFTVPVRVARLSKLVSGMIPALDDDCEEGAAAEEIDDIPLPNVSSRQLSRVLEFCAMHVEKEPMTEIERPLTSNDLTRLVQPWYASFVGDLGVAGTVELLVAANYLDVGPLLNLCMAEIGCKLKDRRISELRAYLGVAEPATPEEIAADEQLRISNAWALDPRDQVKATTPAAGGGGSN